MTRGARVRLRVVAAGAALVLAGCGSRLAPADRAAAVIGVGSQADRGQTQTTDAGATADSVVAGSDAPATAGGTSASSSSTRTASSVTRSASAGGEASNGGSTDVGVTATEITLSTIANVSGVSPGIFKSVHQAMEALTAYGRTQPPIDGRRLSALQLDDKTESGGNRAAMLEACDKSFAIVGSMSAFDDGGAEVGEKCGIPHIPATTTNATFSRARNVFAVYPNNPDYWISGNGAYLKQRFPSAVGKAALLWLNVAVAKANADNMKRAYESVGFQYVYTAETQVLEANYVPYVVEMRRRGVEYVAMLADYQSIARLLKAMRSQNWMPRVREFTPTVYDPRFIELAGDAGEGTLVALNSVPLEDAPSNPEIALYLRWLQRVAPGAQPDYFGQYAWSAGRLFARLAQEAGPKLTRAKVLDLLRNTHSWDGLGSHVAHDVGTRTPSVCFLYLEVRNGAFRRADPQAGFMCDKGPLFRQPQQ